MGAIPHASIMRLEEGALYIMNNAVEQYGIMHL